MKGDIKRMETVITFSLAQLIGFIGTIAGLVSAIGLMASYAIKAHKKLKAPLEALERRIKELESKDEEKDQKIIDLEKQLKDGDKRFNRAETSMVVILETLRALLEHSLGGSDSELLKAKSNLDTYLSSSLFGNKQSE